MILVDGLHVVEDKQFANGEAASYIKTKGLVAKMRQGTVPQSIYGLSYYEGMIDVESMTVSVRRGESLWVHRWANLCT